MKTISAAFAAFLLLMSTAFAGANVPSFQDIRDSQVYAHNKDWLKKFPSSFVAANIRGKDLEYAERRLAALDLVRQQRDFGVVSELTLALEQNSFLSTEIISILEDWKAKRAIPLLEKISKDEKRDQGVRDLAAQALASIRDYKPAAPPKY